MILLDTHAVIWLLMESKRLSLTARNTIRDCHTKSEAIACSAASLFEIAYAARTGRLEFSFAVNDFLSSARERLAVLPVSASIAISAAQLPETFRGDPMDRVIAATALAQNCPLITADRRIREAGVCKVIW